MAISTGLGVLLGSLLTAGAAYDANKAAKHQGRLAAEQNTRALEEADRIAREERDMTERINRQNLEAQRAAQAASLAAAQKQAAESRALMDKQLKAAEESMNRATQKRPNTSSILSEAEQAGKAGVSGTMLTGPLGVDPSELKLSKSTLLGY